MSKDKYPSNFQSQMEAIVLIKSSNIFHNTGIFGHMARLDQSRASENTWWIIINN